jgi:signal transduction histidine kinase
MPGLPHIRQGSLGEETRRRSLLVLKALPILLIPIASAVATFVLIDVVSRGSISSPAAPGSRPQAVIALIVVAVFLTALIMLVRIGRPTVSALLLIGGWTLITTVVTLRGGVTSIGPALLVIPICAAGLLIDGVASMSLAVLATALVGGLAWLEMNGLYVVAQPQIPLVSAINSALALPAYAAGIWTGLFWTVALLTSLLAGDLQRALRQSREHEDALRELSSQLEQRVAEQTAELARRTARAEALYQVSQALTSTLDLDQVLALIAEQAARFLAFDSAQVLLQQPDGRFASLGAYGQAGGLAGQTAALEPVLREVGSQRSPRLVNLGDSDSPAPAALMLPMHHQSGLLGVLMLVNANGCAECAGDDLILGQGLADQASVAIANAQLLTQARAAAALEERTRLARDIHDTLAQGLTGVVVQLGAAQRALDAAPLEARSHLALALRMARESLAEARRSVWNLRSPALQRGDLGDALRSLTVRPLGGSVSVSFEQAGELWPLTSEIESTLLRVCQEALVNVAKHAQASEAKVTLEYLPGAVRLSIYDNGVGLDEPLLDDPELLSGPWGGFGLVGMRERVAALGGTLQISSNGGVQIMVEIPRRRDGGQAAAAITQAGVVEKGSEAMP